MPQTNSLGAGPHKGRTINVEVNLLGEWLRSRSKLQDDRLRWTGYLTATALAAVVALPLLSDLAASQRTRVQRAESLANAQATLLTGLQNELSLVQPKLDSEATLSKSQTRAKVFLSEMLTVLNQTSPQMAIETIEGTVLGGEVAIKTKAQAETYLTAQQFVASAGQGKGVKSAILATARQFKIFGPDAVTFEFAKKVTVQP
ncbi:MAG TPA: hypothetical protein PLX06_14105 [Fimbriimonadaceae bacterium]|nr:hypothetical protein [Fimbriimonadaceae bacterium]